MLAFLLLGTLGACERDDAAAALVMERDQLRREVAGIRALADLGRGGLLADDREVLVSVRDTLLQALLSAALPIQRDLPGDVTVQLTGATMRFRSNVARVDVEGTVQRTRFPRAGARLAVRGALQGFTVDTARRLHARIAVDGTELSAPTGVPGPFGVGALRFLQDVIDRALPELAAALPEVVLPVRLDHDLALPAIAPGGAISIAAARAPLRVSASKVVAFRDRLVVIVRLDRDSLERVLPDTTSVAAASPPTGPSP